MKRVSMILAVVVLCLGVPALMLADDNPNIGAWKLNTESQNTPEYQHRKASRVP